MPPPHAARRSSSSWRARQRTRIGPSAQRARNSRKSSRPSSAQWMSSWTRTSGLSRGERLEVAPPGVVEGVAPDALRSSRWPAAPPAPSRSTASPAQPSSAMRASSLACGRRRRVVVEDPGVGLDGVGQGGVRGLGIGEAAALAPVEDVGQAVEVLLELPGQARLADAGRADDGDQVRPALRDHPAHGLLEQGDLLVAPDERRLDAQRRADAAAPRLDARRPARRRPGSALPLRTAAGSSS